MGSCYNEIQLWFLPGVNRTVINQKAFDEPVDTQPPINSNMSQGKPLQVNTWRPGAPFINMDK